MTQTTDALIDYASLTREPGYYSYINKIGPMMCDKYALTMTYTAWELGYAEKCRTVSNVFCRSLLNNGQTYKDSETDDIKKVKVPYLVNAGAGLVAEWFDGWKWSTDDLIVLAHETTLDEKGQIKPLYSSEFLNWLGKQRLTLDIKAMPEGTLIFPQEPSLQISGPWWQQEMVEAAVLSLISSSTNLTTVASQVRIAATRKAAAEGATLIDMSTKDVGSKTESAYLADMSLRRSISIGALQSVRASAITGWNATSNYYGKKCFGPKAMGTFAHAWVMLHDTEEEAFENWAKVHPGMTIYLPDTFSTAQGVQKAIKVCKKYGLRLKGIRLDSGNMAHLSNEVHAWMKEAGFGDADILATDRMTTNAVNSLFGLARSADGSLSSHVTGFGIGSEIAVNQNHPLLDFVMKLCARLPDAPSQKNKVVRDLIKLSETSKKTTLPGLIDVIRYVDKNGFWAGDTIIPADLDIGTERLNRNITSIGLADGKEKVFYQSSRFVHVLEPWMKNGVMLQQAYADRDPDAILNESHERYKETIKHMDPSHLYLTPAMPHRYGVGIAKQLFDKKERKIMDIKGRPSTTPAAAERLKQLERFGLT